MSPSAIVAAVLPVYLLAVIGVFLRKTGMLTADMDKGLMRLTIHFLYPALILDKMLGSSLLQRHDVVLTTLLTAAGIILLGFGVSAVTGHLLGLRRGTGIRTFTLSAAIQNFGYVAVPIVAALYGTSDSLGLLFVHSLGVELCIWTVGLMLLRGAARPDWRLFLNGPIVAVLLGLLLSWSGFAEKCSDVSPLTTSVLRQGLNWLGSCAFPIALLLIGATISDLFGQEKFSLKVVLGSLLVRGLIMPVVILLAAKFLPVALELKQVLVVQAAMPAAVTPIIIARHYGGQPGVAVQVVLATSILGILTIPLLLTFGTRFVF